MKDRVGIILAAGKQTRFKSEVPKALVEYNGKTVLEHNVNILKKYVNTIYVFCSPWNEEEFKKINIDAKIISINSGYGCGDGVMKALNHIPSPSDIILIWGDSIQNEYVIEFLEEKYSGYFLVPVVKEHKPYVQFKTVKGSPFIEEVRFSKFKQEIDEYGYHDLSVFMFDRDLVLKHLKQIHKKYWNSETESYSTKSGELVFLELFNENKNFGKIIQLENIEAKSFNTVEEYKKLVEC